MSQDFTARWVNHIVGLLTDREIKQETKWLNTIISSNGSKGGHALGFTYAGKYFVSGEVTVHERALMRSLHKDLWGEMQDFWKAHNALDKEVQRLRQGLCVLLHPCKTAQDVRDTLPDIVCRLDSALSKQDRTRPEAFTLKNNPIQLHEYAQTRELMDFFLTSRMIY